MLRIRQHLGEDLDRACEPLLSHWSEPGWSDLENQRVPRVAGSESDFLGFSEAPSKLASGARDVSHLHNPHLELSTSP